VIFAPSAKITKKKEKSTVLPQAHKQVSESPIDIEGQGRNYVVAPKHMRPVALAKGSV
jgi:hypothetical protein